ncbi:hypothetical protein [Candidatus Albibeggiatoa sp. nov. BB20]|uniref:hypothetical protein n=1 Tax=Candidatus Albibeggiatoa sp. nov. BB20 TaxID=3162723 RepID=UPI003365A952
MELESIEDIYNSVIDCMADIGAANLTIKSFNSKQSVQRASFLATSVNSSVISEQLYQNLSSHKKEDIVNKFDEYKIFVSESNGNVHKFASAKTYFSHQFADLINKSCRGKKIHIEQHKPDLARILRDLGLPEEFKQLKNFVLVGINC